MDSADWYCVAVQTGEEFRATGRLSDACHSVVCPTRQEIRTKGAQNRARYKVDAPLWAGYLFAEIPESAWGAVYNDKAVLGVVEVAGEPLAIRGRALAALMRLFHAADNGEFDDLAAEERISAGDMLRILFGPWEGEQVTVLRKTGAGLECESTLEILGRRPRVIVHYDEVMPVRAAE